MKSLKRVFIFVFMANMLMMSQNITITAHRGASGHAPENTLSSLRKAIEMGADFCEIDVQETIDGVLILFHDNNFKRTPGIDKNVWETTYDEVKNLEAGCWFDSSYKGEPVPLFEVFLDKAKGKIKLNIELKNNGHQVSLAEKVVDMITEKDFIEECVITSFDFALIDKVKQMNPKIKAGYIFSRLPKFDVFTSNVDLLSVNKGLVDSEFVEKAKQNGKEIHVWTVNKTDEMQKLIDLNVTNIITDFPDRLKALLNKKEE